MDEDTIAAIATVLGEGGISIIRISGSLAVKILNNLFVTRGQKMLENVESHRLRAGFIKRPGHGEIVDEVLIVAMKSPRSYTREDVVEIYCHGGLMAAQEILNLVIDQGARLAEAGEFTKRAFLNGRIDLTQAEAVLDVIRARTGQGLQLAMGGLQGKVGEKIGHFHNRITTLLARIEADLDFPEEDVLLIDRGEIGEEIENLLDAMKNLLEQGKGSWVYREGALVGIIGRPNVGKSSLLNCLVDEERAIVTAVPGTTRDLIEETINLNGIPVRLVDTAGICNSNDEVEKIGIKRSFGIIHSSLALLMVIDLDAGIQVEDRRLLEGIPDKEVVLVGNKLDLVEEAKKNKELLVDLHEGHREVVLVSARTGQGLKDLKKAILRAVNKSGLDLSGEVMMRKRQIDLLAEGKAELEAARQALDTLPLDFLAENLRQTRKCLGKINGQMIEDDILDHVFADFCIGK